MKKKLIIAAVVVFVLAVIGAATKKDKSEKATATTTTTELTTTTAEPVTSTKAPATTTTKAPTTTVPEETFEASGSGDDVITIPASMTSFPADITYTGSSNFAVKGSDLFVNTIGDYQGRVILSPGVTEISASGPWTIHSVPVADLREIGSALIGKGDDVLSLERSGPYAVTHDGTSNFMVQTTDGLAINEIGAYQGTVLLEKRTVVVHADGNWSFTAK